MQNKCYICTSQVIYNTFYRKYPVINRLPVSPTPLYLAPPLLVDFSKVIGVEKQESPAYCAAVISL